MGPEHGRTVRQGDEQSPEDYHECHIRWLEAEGLDRRSGHDGQGVRCRGVEGCAYDEVSGSYIEFGSVGE